MATRPPLFLSPGIASDPVLRQRVEDSRRRALEEALSAMQQRELDAIASGRARGAEAGSAIGGRSTFASPGPRDINLDAPVLERPSFGDVQAGSSSTATPEIPTPEPPPPPPPLQESMEDLKSRLGYVDNRFTQGPREVVRGFGRTWERPVSGGSVSMPTAPENVERMTVASREEDRLNAIREEAQRRDLEDPSWRERMRADAEVDRAVRVEQGRAGVKQESQERELETFLARAEPLQADIDTATQELNRLRETPEYKTAPPERQKAIEDQYATRIGNAQRRLRLLQQGTGFATGNVPSALMSPEIGGDFR